MRTPDGRECPFYYADSHRRAGTRETCHLLAAKPDAAANWTSDLCFGCPVPDIKRANRCADMVLEARIGTPGWRFWEKPRMLIDATCVRSRGRVENPMVGCGLCHGSLTFIVAEEESHDD
jgi:hypothetical protein